MKLHQNEQWLKKQHQEGKSFREIAAMAGVSSPTIRTAFRHFGIKSRTISEALFLKPSRRVWTEADRKKQSKKMTEVLSTMGSELSKTAKLNWVKYRDKIVAGIKRAVDARLIPVAIDNLPEMLKKYTLVELGKIAGVAHSTIRRRLRALGIDNAMLYKKLKIDFNELAELLKTHTQKECGEIIGCSGSYVGDLAAKAGIELPTELRNQTRERISKIVKEHWTDETYRHKMAEVRAKLNNSGTISGIQRQLYEILDELKVEYEPEVTIGPFTFDCLVENKLLIECNGNYWHSMPKCISNDQNKSNYIATYHAKQYRLRAIWEHEFKKPDRIRQLLLYWLERTPIATEKFEFADLSIKAIDQADYKSFLSQHHYLVYCHRGNHAVGAYHNDQLVGVVVFAPLIRQNLPYDYDSTIELARLCIHPSYQIKNFGSWLLAKSINTLPSAVAKIVAYCDTTYNHTGGVYYASNFKLDHEIKPDYWFVSPSGWVLHKKTVYNRAVKSKMTEAAYAKKEQMQKVHGKKKLCFIFERKTTSRQKNKL